MLLNVINVFFLLSLSLPVMCVFLGKCTKTGLVWPCKSESQGLLFLHVSADNIQGERVARFQPPKLLKRLYEVSCQQEWTTEPNPSIYCIPTRTRELHYHTKVAKYFPCYIHVSKWPVYGNMTIKKMQFQSTSQSGLCKISC